MENATARLWQMILYDYGNSVIRGVDMAEYINRDLHELLIRMAGWFPVVSLTGPRQSGKSTLVRHAFPDYSYVTLEDPQTRRAALEDPVSFIRNRKGGLIIDEAQYAPDLFSMIQVVSDERGDAGQYILTGSQNFLTFRQKEAKNCPKSARIRKGASFAQARASAPIKPIFIAITGTVTRNGAMSMLPRWRNCGKRKK